MSLTETRSIQEGRRTVIQFQISSDDDDDDEKDKVKNEFIHMCPFEIV